MVRIFLFLQARQPIAHSHSRTNTKLSAEDALESMQRRVHGLKLKLSDKVAQQRASAAAVAAELSHAQAQVLLLTERCGELGMAGERERAATLAAAERAEAAENASRRWQEQANDLSAQIADQTAALVRQRVESEAKISKESAALAALDDLAMSLREQLRASGDRLAASEQQLGQCREEAARLEAAANRMRAAEAECREEAAARQTLANQLNEATAAIGKLKGMLRSERAARLSAEEGASKQAAVFAETSALERTAAAGEVRSLSASVTTLRVAGESAKRAAEQRERALEAQAAQAKRDAAQLSAELTTLLGTLDSERAQAKGCSAAGAQQAQASEARERQLRAQLEAALTRGAEAEDRARRLSVGLKGLSTGPLREAADAVKWAAKATADTFAADAQSVTDHVRRAAHLVERSHAARTDEAVARERGIAEAAVAAAHESLGACESLRREAQGSQQQLVILEAREDGAARRLQEALRQHAEAEVEHAATVAGLTADAAELRARCAEQRARARAPHRLSSDPSPHSTSGVPVLSLGRVRQSEEWERAQSEVAMLAEVQRMEMTTLRRALEAKQAEHAEEVKAQRAHFEGELAKVTAQHQALVEQLERGIAAERARYAHGTEMPGDGLDGDFLGSSLDSTELPGGQVLSRNGDV
jgi:hypothetical protein